MWTEKKYIRVFFVLLFLKMTKKRILPFGPGFPGNPSPGKPVSPVGPGCPESPC